MSDYRSIHEHLDKQRVWSADGTWNNKMDDKRNSDLAILDQQIKALIAKRNELELESNDAEIKDLSWTKDCDARLAINPLRAAGLPVYVIYVTGKHIPGSHGFVQVMGESTYYERNVIYTKEFGSDYGEFRTSDKDCLIRFMNIIEFASFDYDHNDYEVLMAANAKANHKANDQC